MDKEQFTKLEYISLREEIKETKARIYKTLSFGVLGIPAVNYLVDSQKVRIFILFMPLLIIVVALVYLSENRAKMRCGRYILFHIEKDIKDLEAGWETWLEKPDMDGRDKYDTRCVDRYLDYCLYILFLIYYAGSIFLAVEFICAGYNWILAIISLGFYVAIGIWFLFFLRRNIQFSTTRKGEVI